MAACPALSPLARSRRPRLTLTPQRLEANRRNAARSTGPRTAQGKARVARNAIKHGFFLAQERWSPQQHRDFEALLAGLLEDFRPDGPFEETCVRVMAESWVRMASALRYESIAALRHHQELERALDRRIEAADPAESARLKALREDLRGAGLWRPTLPNEREAIAIARYLARLERTIRQARQALEAVREEGPTALRLLAKSQKQTHYSATPNSGPEASRGTSAQRFADSATPNGGAEALRRGVSAPQVRRNSDNIENAKTNPLSSTFAGNRHQRRRAKALARRRT